MSSGSNWVGVLMTFLVPLGLGILCLWAPRKIRQPWARLLLRFFGGAALVVFLLLLITMTPYLWALHLESKWEAANPKTRAELESCLSLYSRHNIQPSQSPWANRYQLKPDEHMVQYWLLYSPGAPLDVVYTTHDAIVQIYTSYE